MQPIDYRNATWESLQGQVTGLRLAVLEALRVAGDCTTRQLAARSGLDILTVRPRVTELVQLGLVKLTPVDSGNGHEGVYRALTIAEAQKVFAVRQAEAQRERQMSLL